MRLGSQGRPRWATPSPTLAAPTLDRHRRGARTARGGRGRLLVLRLGTPGPELKRNPGSALRRPRSDAAYKFYPVGLVVRTAAISGQPRHVEVPCRDAFFQLNKHNSLLVPKRRNLMTEPVALITGVTGQDGAYLAALLLQK